MYILFAFVGCLKLFKKNIKLNYRLPYYNVFSQELTLEFQWKLYCYVESLHGQRVVQVRGTKEARDAMKLLCYF